MSTFPKHLFKSVSDVGASEDLNYVRQAVWSQSCLFSDVGFFLRFTSAV